MLIVYYKNYKNFMKNFPKKILLLLLLISLMFISCARNKDKIKKPEEVPPLKLLYKTAYKNYQDGDWDEALKLFKKVESKYSFSDWAPRATLMIIYIYYEAGEYIETLENIKKFKNINQDSQYSEYVDYIAGLVFYEQISIPARDQTYAIKSLELFNKLLKNYPNTIYKQDIIFKIDLIKEQLAGKEMYLARYYMKKEKWIAAIKRLKIILDVYPNTNYTIETLHRLVEIYYKLGNLKESKKYAAILGYNFNDSDWYKKSYKLVGDKDYDNIKKKQKIDLKEKIKKILSFSE
jgi:outer membrane protein assembly factor BamD